MMYKAWKRGLAIILTVITVTSGFDSATIRSLAATEPTGYESGQDGENQEPVIENDSNDAEPEGVTDDLNDDSGLKKDDGDPKEPADRIDAGNESDAENDTETDAENDAETGEEADESEDEREEDAFPDTLPGEELPGEELERLSGAVVEASGTYSTGLTWTLTENGDSLENGKKALTLTIAGEGAVPYIGGSGAPFYSYWQQITSVIISEGVTDVEQLGGMQNLTDISLPNTLETIGRLCFSYAPKLTAVTIPGSVKTVCDYAFSGCSQLETITLREGLENLDFQCFSDCPKVKTLALPSTLKSIGGLAFFGTSIRELVIPASVTTIAANCFQGSMLEKIVFEGELETIPVECFLDCKRLTDVTFPSGLTTIAKRAFYGSGLKNIVIPDGVTNIREGAFCGCESLETIEIPASVTSFGSGFVYEPVFPETTTIIAEAGTDAISYAKAHDFAFRLKNVLNHGYCGTEEQGTESIFWAVKALEDENYRLEISIEGYHYGDEPYFEMADFPSADDAPWAAYADRICEIYVPYKLKKIGANAFSGCVNLREFVCGKDTEYEASELPSGVSYTRYYGKGSAGENIDYALTLIRQDEYHGAQFRLKFTGSGPMKNYSGYAAETPEWYFYRNNLSEIRIAEGITTIGDNAFKGIGSVNAVNIPSTVTSIGADAFYQARDVKIVLTDAVTEIKRDAFNHAQLLDGSYVIPAHVQSIGEAAFLDASIPHAVNLPDTLTQIGERAFAQSFIYGGIRIPRNASFMQIPDALFALANTRQQTVEIPDTITQIGRYAFFGMCEIDESLWGSSEPAVIAYNIPEEVTAIGYNAFGYDVYNYYDSEDENGEISRNGRQRKAVLYGKSGSAAEAYANAEILDTADITEQALYDAAVGCSGGIKSTQYHPFSNGCDIWNLGPNMDRQRSGLFLWGSQNYKYDFYHTFVDQSDCYKLTFLNEDGSVFANMYAEKDSASTRNKPGGSPISAVKGNKFRYWMLEGSEEAFDFAGTRISSNLTFKPYFELDDVFFLKDSEGNRYFEDDIITVHVGETSPAYSLYYISSGEEIPVQDMFRKVYDSGDYYLDSRWHFCGEYLQADNIVLENEYLAMCPEVLDYSKHDLRFTGKQESGSILEVGRTIMDLDYAMKSCTFSVKVLPAEPGAEYPAGPELDANNPYFLNAADLNTAGGRAVWDRILEELWFSQDGGSYVLMDRALVDKFAAMDEKYNMQKGESWYFKYLYDFYEERNGAQPWAGDYMFYHGTLTTSYLGDPEWLASIEIGGKEYVYVHFYFDPSGYYNLSTAQHVEMERWVDDYVNKLVKKGGVLDPGKYPTDAERVKAAYNWVTSNIKYNSGYNSKNDGFSNVKIYYFAYSAFKEKKGSCEGMAQAFYYLCRKMGVNCRILFNSGGHVYNLVQVGGKWYYTDCSAGWNLKGYSKVGTFRTNEFILPSWCYDYKVFKKNYIDKVPAADFSGTGTVLAPTASIEKITYNGQEQIPSVTVKFGGSLIESGYTTTFYKVDESGNIILEQENGSSGVIETVTDAGTYAAVISDIPNYSDELTVKFHVEKLKVSSLTISDPPGVPYNGSKYEPEVSVKFGDEEVDPSWITISYGDNTAVGKGTVTISAVNPNLTGTVTKEFAISKIAMNSAVEVTDMEDEALLGEAYRNKLLIDYNWKDDGSARRIYYVKDNNKPEVQLRYNGEDLAAGRDYSIAFANNKSVNPGTSAKTAPKLTITGKGNFAGTLSVTYAIDAAPMDYGTSFVSDTMICSYTGADQKPAPRMKQGSASLTNNTDYIVKYVAVKDPLNTVLYEDENEEAYLNRVAAAAQVPAADATDEEKELASRLLTAVRSAGTYAMLSFGKGNFDSATFCAGAHVEVTPMSVNKLTAGAGAVKLAAWNNEESGEAGYRAPLPVISAKNGKTSLKGIEKSAYDALAEIDRQGYDYVYAYYDAMDAAQGDAEAFISTLSGFAVSATNRAENPVTETGTEYVVLYGIGNFGGARVLTYQVNGMDISKAVVTASALTYDPLSAETETGIRHSTGENANLTVKLTKNSPALTEDMDYRLIYSDNKAAGKKAAVTVQGIGLYSGSVKKTFTINPALLKIAPGAPGYGTEPVTIVTFENWGGWSSAQQLDSPSMIYSNEGNRPAVTQVTYQSNMEQSPTALISGKDYTITYSNNAKAGTASAAKAPTITIKGKGNYSGTLTQKFSIEEADISSEMGITYTQSAAAYSGSKVTPAVSVFWNGKKLPSSDYSIDYAISPENNYVNSGTYRAYIRGKGNLRENREITLTVSPADIAKTTFTLGNVAWNAENPNPKVTKAVLGKYVLKEGDYSVTYAETGSSAAGSVHAVVYGAGNFTGEKTVTYQVTPKSGGALSSKNVKIEFLDAKGAVMKTPKYDIRTYGAGEEVIPAYRVKINGVLAADSSNPIFDGICTVDFTNDRTIGNAKLTVTGDGTKGYSGSVSGTYTIYGQDIKTSNLSVTGFESSVTYNADTAAVYGGMIQDGIAVQCIANKNEPVSMIKDVDYTVSYSKHNKVGKATMTIKGIGFYSGSASYTYTIKACPVSSLNAALVTAEDMPAIPIYQDGALTEPAYVTFVKGGAGASLQLRDGEQILPTSQYTVSVSNNKAAIAAAEAGNKPPTITITGKGNYSGSLKIPFNIVKKDISVLTESLAGQKNAVTIANKKYSSKKGAWKSDPVIKDTDGKTLTVGSDYTAEYFYLGLDEEGNETRVIINQELRSAMSPVEANDIVPVGTRIGVRITGKGNYEGGFELDYKIL